MNFISTIVDNLAEEIHKIKSKDCSCFLEYESVSDNLTKYNRLSCNEHYSNKTDKKLKIQFKNTFKFCNNDVNEFIIIENVFILMNGKI